MEENKSHYTNNMYEKEIVDFENKYGNDVAYILKGKKIQKPKEKIITAISHRYICVECGRIYQTEEKPILCSCGMNNFKIQKIE